MNDTEIRVRCIEAAVRVPGNPNTVQQAREFYEFATAGLESTFEGDVTDVLTNIDPTATPFMKAANKKGSRK